MNQLDTNLTGHFISSLNRILPNIPSALLFLLIGLIAMRILSAIVRGTLRLGRLPKGLAGILTSLFDALLWVFLAIAILQQLGLSNLAFAVSGSVAVILLGLANGATDLTKDILSGVFLARDRDFNVGDTVRAGETPTEGTIESMDMRRVRMRGQDGQLHVLPNSAVEQKEWVVLERSSGKK